MPSCISILHPHRQVCVPTKNKSVFPAENDFKDMVAYFMKLAMIESMAQIRNDQGACPEDVLQALLDLLHNNDNTRNAVRLVWNPASENGNCSQGGGMDGKVSNRDYKFRELWPAQESGVK